MPAALILRRYSDPSSTGWQAALEPADRSWIVYSDLDGHVRMFVRDRFDAAVPPSVPADEVLQ